MSDQQLVCPNDDCKGRDFEHASGNSWKCVYCGTVVTLHQKTVKKKIKPSKEVRKVKEYPSLTMICEQCGTTIGIINHPREEQQFNKDWLKHTCPDKSNIYT